MSDRIPTLADVCSAIAEGHVAVAIDGSMYQVNALELRRYFSKPRPLSVSSTAPDSTAHPDSPEWSTPTTTSVA
jgi:hypothetical protein